MMNFTVIPTEVLRDEEFKSTEKLVYLYLMGLAGSGGNCFPSINTMIKELKLSRQTICNAIKSLQDKNKIFYVRRQGKGGEYLSNYYLVTNRCYDNSPEALREWKNLYLSGLINLPETVIIGSGDCNAENQGSNNC